MELDRYRTKTFISKQGNKCYGVQVSYPLFVFWVHWEWISEKGWETKKECHKEILEYEEGLRFISKIEPIEKVSCKDSGHNTYILNDGKCGSCGSSTKL